MIVWSCCGYASEPARSSKLSWLLSIRRLDGLTLPLVPLCTTPEGARAAYKDGRPRTTHFWPFQIQLERVS